MTTSVIAAQGPNDSLVFYWQTVGSLQWNPEQVAGPGTCFSAPSVARVGNSTVIAAQGPDDSLAFYWQPIGSLQWNPEQVAGPGTTVSAPSVAQVGNSTVIAAQGPDDSLAFYWQPIGSLQWNPEQVAGPGTTVSAPSVAQVGNSTVIAAQGPDDSLAFYWQPIGSLQWNPEQVAGPGTTVSAPSVAQVGNSTVIAAQGPDDSLAFYWQPIGSLQWNPEQVAGPGTTVSAPSVAQVGNSTVIAAQGPDDSLAFYWQPIGSLQWNPEQVAGPGTTVSAPSVAQVGNSTVIAAQGPDDSLAFYWQPIGSLQWNPEQVAGPGTTLSAAPVAQVEPVAPPPPSQAVAEAEAEVAEAEVEIAEAEAEAEAAEAAEAEAEAAEAAEAEVAEAAEAEVAEAEAAEAAEAEVAEAEVVEVEVALAPVERPGTPTSPPVDRSFALPHGLRPGRLVVVGSGIKSIAQFTLETVAHIENADIVFYAVADPATECFIEEKNPNAFDLYPLYDDDKPRHETYTQMAEVMLREVRSGRYVVGVFYGHPGVFVNPSHRALAIARDEGYEALMLPGISAEDNLFADLGVDPSRPGCQIVEATDLLLRERPLLTESHVIIFQVGSVGDLGFNFKGFPNDKFHVLVDRLAEEYGDEHELIHYVAAQFPIVAPTKETYRVGELRDPVIAKRITGISTFYLPPRTLRQGNEAMAKKLGLRLPANPANAGPVSNAGPFSSREPYGKRELKAVANLEKHKVPRNYRKTRSSQAMFDALRELATKPGLLDFFNSSPEAFLATRQGLGETERRALVSRHPGLLRMAMKKTSEEVASEFVRRELRDPLIARQYLAALTRNQAQQNGEASVWSWLRHRDFDTTPEAIYQAYLDLQDTWLDFYDSQYNTVLGGQVGPVIVIQNGAIAVDGMPIKNASYSNSRLSWDAASGNASSARLTFQVLAAENSPTSANTYIGPQFSGTYWPADQSEPTGPNISGRSGIYSAEGFAHPAQADPIVTWSGSYQIFLKNRDGRFEAGDMLAVDADDNSAAITYGGIPVENFQYANNMMSWEADGCNRHSASLYFYRDSKSARQNLTAGNRLFGKFWAANAQPALQGNCFGQIGACSDPGAASKYGESEYQRKLLGINLAIGAASILRSMTILEPGAVRRR